MKPSRRTVLDMLGKTAVALASSVGAGANAYPQRPIRLVVPYAAGGSSDQIARLWMESMPASFGQIYIENLGGAGGEIGCSIVARSAPDGRTLLLGNVSTQVMIPAASVRPKYDSRRDFQGVYRLMTSSLAFVVHPAVPARNLAEFAAYSKAHSGRLSYGTPGVGTGNHLVGETFKRISGSADLVHIPYKNIGQASNDLLGGQIPLMIAVVSAPLLDLHRAGSVRMIAVTSDRRLSAAPAVPTVLEEGLEELRYSGWFGLFVPKATPGAIFGGIAELTRAAMADPALQRKYRDQGMEPDTNSAPESFQKLVEADIDRLTPIVRSVGLQRD